MEDPSTKEEPARVLNVLEALKQASLDLQASSDDSNSSAIKLCSSSKQSPRTSSPKTHISRLSLNTSQASKP
ncbi:hypothetical protein Dsin_017832 [Dipteronia sinensis]|uniref:Uncharacterized protein n=1 Tax=Dipteronia sinensis TaxID=43782 RepID=A0AAE0E6T9_9ROSI|nr:hypothetical protein Dsin_017832 [Dipteronia sinensis]